MRSFTSSLDPICILSSLSWKEGEKKKREKKSEKKEKKSLKKVREKKGEKEKEKEKKVREKKVQKNYQKIGSNFSRGKLKERVVVYPAWQLFFIIIFTAVVIFTYILLSRAN